ncbi:MAG: hypothetical protein RBR67_17575 [Desulfobacterium sp.]|nr:hypothetical protein [Desulfobacterium sp.]
MGKANVLEMVVDCLERLNQSLIVEERVSTMPDDVLFGEGSFLDSMGLLNLLIDVEEHLEEHDIFITILDDHALSQKHSPFKSIATLTDYICSKTNNAF